MIWGLDTIDGMVSSALGLTGAIEALAKSVVYTVGETVSCSSTSVLQPRLYWTDAAFKFNFK